VFNQDVTYFNTGKVTNMQLAFGNCPVFNNGDVAGASTKPLNWDTSQVLDMQVMFGNCTAFNQPLITNGNIWKVESVINMNQMFLNATSFKQDISSWRPYACIAFLGMFYGADMNTTGTTTNYDNLLTTWGQNPVLPLLKNSVVFSAGNSKYTVAVAQASRNNLTTAPPAGRGWTIYDFSNPQPPPP